MPDPEQRNELVEAAKTEISEMAKEGFDHPSSKLVLIGAGIGAVVGFALLHGGWFLGMLIGAAVALYLRIKK